MAGKKIGSGAGVLLVAFLQLIIGVVLLGLFEGYKVYRIRYFDKLLEQYQAEAAKAQTQGTTAFDPNVLRAQAAISSTSPMGVVWWISIACNVFAICGLTGVLNAQRDLVIAFFSWNAVQMVAGAHFFVDMIVDTTVRYGGEPDGLTSYEKATALFLLIGVLLAGCASALAMRAIEEIRAKAREEYRGVSMAALGDTLQFEPDRA